MRVVNEAVENGCCEDRIGEHFAPLLERFVARDDDRTALVAFGDDAEDVIGDDLIEWSKAEFVQHDEIRFDVLRDESFERKVGHGSAHPRGKVLDCREEHAVPAHTRFDGQRGSEMRLTDAGRSDEEHVLVLRDEFTGCE